MPVKKDIYNTNSYLYYAENDFQSAISLAKSNNDRTLNNIVVLSQQFYEKFLKSILTEINEVDKKILGSTHDLSKLLQLSRVHYKGNKILNTMVEDLRRIDRTYIPLRYPTSRPIEISEEEIEVIVGSLVKNRDNLYDKILVKEAKKEKGKPSKTNDSNKFSNTIRFNKKG